MVNWDTDPDALAMDPELRARLREIAEFPDRDGLNVEVPESRTYLSAKELAIPERESSAARDGLEDPSWLLLPEATRAALVDIFDGPRGRRSQRAIAHDLEMVQERIAEELRAAAD